MDIRCFLLYVTIMIETRFSTALQMMVNIAVDGESGRRCTSQTLAERLNTNSSFVRKLLAPLVGSGLITSAVGNGGGIKLARDATAISLGDIYRCINSDTPLWKARSDVPEVCFVSSNIGSLSQTLCDKAETAVCAALASTTIADAIAELERLETHKLVESQRVDREAAR
jgi:Rrf2 family transcriptional repressor of oqxAB